MHFENKDNINNAINRLHKVKMNVHNENTPITIALIKSNESGNFDLILDKEYEASYKTELSKLKIQNCIFLTKTLSDNYLLKFREYSTMPSETFNKIRKPSEKLIKFKRNNKKIPSNILIKNNSKHKQCNVAASSVRFLDRKASPIKYFEDLKLLEKKMKSKCTTALSCMNFSSDSKNCKSNSFQGPDISEHKYNLRIHQKYSTEKIGQYNLENVNKNILVNRFISDQLLLKKINIIIQDTGNCNVETIGYMKRDFGYYVIQFGDITDVKLIRLVSFLSVYKQCYRPVKFDSKNKCITISLDENKIMSPNEMYGLLKSTLSGNIVMLIDEHTMTQMNKDIYIANSYHIIQSVIKPENKAVNTSCNAKNYTEQYDLCNKDKCLCESLPNAVKKYWLPERENIVDCGCKQGKQIINRKEYNIIENDSKSLIKNNKNESMILNSKIDISFKHIIVSNNMNDTTSVSDITINCQNLENKFSLSNLPLQLPSFLTNKIII